jgi:hypothetical protein
MTANSNQEEPRGMLSAKRAGWRPRLSGARLTVSLALGIGGMLSRPTGEEFTEPRAVKAEEASGGGTVAVGDSALTAPAAPVRAPFAWVAIALEMPPKPIPGQRRPDATGRCPGRMQVSIHGGCWYKVVADLKDCEEDGYVYKGGCYLPAYPLPRPATSGPANHPEAQR